MTSYTVRPAVAADARAIAEIHVASWQVAYRGLMPDEHLASLTVAKRETFWRDAIEYAEPQVHLALDGGTPVGFVALDRSRDPKTPATTGEIWALYVAPAHWGQGAGLALWDAAREACEEEGFTVVTLWVLLRNDRALRFYELAGFKRELPSARTIPVGGVRLEEIRLRRPLG
jgi:ribosomal protein S18 acetylase RimI-like enzyme